MKIRARWWIAGAAAVVLLTYVGIRFFYSLQENEWAIERQAVQIAYQKSVLVHPVKVERFVGNKPYTIIHGEDKIGQGVIVWVSDDQVHTEMAADGVTKEQIEANLLQKRPEANILRITPGVMNDQPVWEAFYYLKDNSSGNRYFYDYYSFRDGAGIDTYTLNLQ